MKAAALGFIFLMLVSCGRNPSSYLVAGAEDGVGGPKQDENPPTPELPPVGLTLQPYYRVVDSSFVVQPKRTKADIIFSIDNSGSVVERIKRFEQDLPIFFTELKSAGVDFQAVVLKNTEIAQDDFTYDTAPFGPHGAVRSTDPDAASKTVANIAAVRTGYRGWHERPLGIFKDFFETPARRNLIRAGSLVTFYVFSDAVDPDLGSNETRLTSDKEFLRNLFSGGPSARDWVMLAHGVHPQRTCSEVEFAHQYLLNDLAFVSGGALGDLCESAYDVFQSVAIRSVKFSLAQSPAVFTVIPEGRLADPASFRVTIDGTEIPMSEINGFVWNDGSQRISFPGSYYPATGKTVLVHLEYQEP